MTRQEIDLIRQLIPLEEDYQKLVHILRRAYQDQSELYRPVLFQGWAKNEKALLISILVKVFHRKPTTEEGSLQATVFRAQEYATRLQPDIWIFETEEAGTISDDETSPLTIIPVRVNFETRLQLEELFDEEATIQGIEQLLREN